MSRAIVNRRRLASQMRAGAVLVLGALAMHWLCYLPSAGSATGAGARMHEYVIGATPSLIVVAAAFVIVSLAISFGSPRHGDAATRPFEVQAARYAGVLLALFLFQELGEFSAAGLVGDGTDAIFGAAGWLVVPAAFFVGVAAALAARTLDRVERRLAERVAIAWERSELVAPPIAPDSHVPRLATRGLAFGLARRPPPPPLRA